LGPFVDTIVRRSRLAFDLLSKYQKRSFIVEGSFLADRLTLELTNSFGHAHGFFPGLLEGASPAPEVATLDGRYAVSASPVSWLFAIIRFVCSRNQLHIPTAEHVKLLRLGGPDSPK